jgi:hypothetical protein
LQRGAATADLVRVFERVHVSQHVHMLGGTTSRLSFRATEFPQQSKLQTCSVSRFLCFAASITAARPRTSPSCSSSRHACRQARPQQAARRRLWHVVWWSQQLLPHKVRQGFVRCRHQQQQHSSRLLTPRSGLSLQVPRLRRSCCSMTGPCRRWTLILQTSSRMRSAGRWAAALLVHLLATYTLRCSVQKVLTYTESHQNVAFVVYAYNQAAAVVPGDNKCAEQPSSMLYFPAQSSPTAPPMRRLPELK